MNSRLRYLYMLTLGCAYTGNKGRPVRLKQEGNNIDAYITHSKYCGVFNRWVITADGLTYG